MGADGAVVNVVAMLTGNAGGMVSSFGAGAEAAKKFKEQYENTTVAVGAGSKSMAEASARQAEAAQAAADKSVAAIEKTRQAAQTAAAQAQVAADRTTVAQEKAAASAQKAADLQKVAAETGAEADVAAADTAIAAADRAANAATLAAERQATAYRVAGDAALAEAAAVQESTKLQEAAQAAATTATEAATVKRNTADIAASATATKVAVGSVAALAIVGGASLEMAGKFEKSTELLVTAGGESQANLGKVRDGILNVATATGISAEQLSEGMYTVEKATFRGADGLNVLKAAAEGAAAENVDMGTMTNALTSIMMSYHLTGDKAVMTTNELVAGAGAAKTTMQEYASSLSTVLPVASAAGISFEQVGGAIATLTQHGTSAAESTQELANTIRSLQAPNNVAVAAMQQLGINAQDVAANLGTRGLTGTISLVTDAISQHLGPEGLVMVDTMKKSATGAADLHAMMNQMSPALRDAAQGFLDGNVSAKKFSTEIKGLGAEGDAQGKQFMSLAVTVAGYNDQIKHGGPAAQTAAAALKAIMGGATGMNTALMLGNENMKTFTEKTDEMAAAAKNSGDDISTNAATQATLAATTERVKQTFEALTIQLGTALMPVVKDVLNNFLSMVKWLQDNKGAAEALGIGILTVVGGFTAWVAISKVWATTMAMSEIATAALTAETWSLNAAWDANPIGIVVLALAALVGAFVWAYNNVGWFKDGVDAAWKWIQEATKNVVDWIKDTAVPFLVDAWGKIAAGAKWMYENAIKPAWDGIMNVIRPVWEWLKNVYVPFMTGAFDTIGKGAKYLYDTFLKPVWDNTLGAFKAFYDWVKDTFVPWISGAWENMGKGADTLYKTYIKPAWDNIMAVMKPFYDWVKETFERGLKEFCDNWGKASKELYDTWIKPAWDNIMKAMKGVHDWIKDTFTKSSKDFYDKFGAGAQVMYDTQIKPAWGNTLKDMKAVYEFAKLTFLPQWLDSWKKAGQAISALYTIYIKPAVDAISAVFKFFFEHTLPLWLAFYKTAQDGWDKAAKNIFEPWGKALDHIGKFMKLVNDQFNIPFWGAVYEVANKAYTKTVKDVFEPWGKILDFIGKLMKETNDKFMVPFWSAFYTLANENWAKTKKDVFDPILKTLDIFAKTMKLVDDQYWSPTWKNIQLVADVAWTYMQKNIFNPIGDAVKGIGDAMVLAQKVISIAWGNIKTDAASPAKFLIETVYDNVARVWNAASAAVGITDKQLPIIKAAGFATGGIMPGYSPGVDNHVIAVGGGEAIMRPEWTRAVGAGNVHAMNAMAAQGNTSGIKQMMGYADGGIAGMVMPSVTSSLRPANGQWQETLNAIPKQFVTNLAEHFDPIVAAQKAISNIGGPAGGAIGGSVDQWSPLVGQALSMLGQPLSLLATTLRRMNQESGGNARAINDWDSNAAAGIPSKGLMQVIDPTFAANAMPGYNTDIYDPLSNILASMRYAIGRYGSLAGAYDQPGGYSMGGITPTLYDKGGYLPTGTSLVQNNTGTPERILAPGQTSMDGATFELIVPELGGRLKGYIQKQTSQAVSDINRGLRGSAGIRAGANA